MKARLTPLLFCVVLVQPGAAQTITEFPYVTGFEGVEGDLNENFPSGWTTVDLNGEGAWNTGWLIIKNSGDVVNAHTDSTAAFLAANPVEACADFLFSPPVQLDASALYTFSFWYRANAIEESIEALDVQLYAAIDPEMDAGLLFTGQHIDNQEYVLASIEFSPPSSGIYHFGFHGFSGPQAGSMLFLDDITISGPPSTGVIEHASTELNIAPNPVSTQLRIAVPHPDPKAQLTLFAGDGRCTWTGPFASVVDVSALANGAYVLQLLSAQGELRGTQRIIINH